MPGTVTLTGLAANDPVPGNYIEINFAQGDASLGTNTYPVLLLGNKTSAGSATVDTVVYGPSSSPPLNTEADAIALFGAGSELHLMVRRFLKVNKDSPLYALAVTASAGTAATRNFTLTNAATGNGTYTMWVGDEFIDTSIASGDAIAAIAQSVVDNVNSQTHWPVTATRTTVTTTNDTITLTAKIAGPRGNFIRTQGVITSGIATTTTSGTVAVLASGATADSNTTALTTIIGSRYYYIVSAAEDATQLGAVATQVDSQATPTTGIRQRVFAGSVGTSAAVKTIAQGINKARVEVVWLQNHDWTPAEIAANAAAVYALEEAPLDFRCNFSGYGNDANSSRTWFMKAPRDGTTPTRSTIKDLLNNAVTPIGVNTNGSTYLVKRVTTRYQSSSVADYRIRDAHKVTILDRFADDLQTKVTLQLAGKKIGNDPIKGERIPGPNVVTPRVFRALISKLIRDYEELDLFENVTAMLDAMLVIRESSPTSRLSARIPCDCIDILDQVASAIDQVG